MKAAEELGIEREKMSRELGCSGEVGSEGQRDGAEVGR